jgi:hypothetical protein
LLIKDGGTKIYWSEENWFSLPQNVLIYISIGDKNAILITGAKSYKITQVITQVQAALDSGRTKGSKLHFLPRGTA